MPDTTGVRRVRSNQQGVHEKLRLTVARHLVNDFRKPYAVHSLAAFSRLSAIVEAQAKPLVFDSGCGVGESTLHLARQHPEALVIGIDKSDYRINKHQRLCEPDEATNYLLVRADLNDIWRLAAAAGWRLSRHYILYPNPWPKARHLQRRWHAAPVFPALLALGGCLELRSNWEIYVREFGLALGFAGQRFVVERYKPGRAITPFERKYSQATQPLWRCLAVLA